MANHQPTLLVAGAALVIATSLMVAGVASQNIKLGTTSATRPVPNAQAVERALVTVRAGEHQGLRPGWADGAATAAGATRLPDKAQGHVGLSELAGGITSGTGNRGLSEVLPNGSTQQAAASAIASSQLLDKVDGNMGFTGLASGAYEPDVAPNLPAGNWGQNQVPSAAGDEILIPANFYAPGVPSLPVLRPKAESGLGPDSPSYSQLIDHRRGEKYRVPAAEEPDAFNRAGPTIR